MDQTEKLRVAEKINRQVNQKIIWTDDLVSFGKIDHWATYPEMTAKYGTRQWRGDCDDYAGVKRHLLVAAGFDPEELEMCIVEITSLPRPENMHMILIFRPDGVVDPYVLDNRYPEIWRVRDLPDYRPVCSFTEKGIWDYGEPTSFA